MLNLCIYSVSNFVFNAQIYDLKEKSNEFFMNCIDRIFVVVFFTVMFERVKFLFDRNNPNRNVVVVFFSLFF